MPSLEARVSRPVRGEVPPARRGHGPKREGQRDRTLGADRDCRTHREDHKSSSDPDDSLDPFRGCNCLRALPHLRRLDEERDHPGYRLADGCCLVHAAVHHARGAAALRGLHASLASGRPLPRPWHVHGHTPRSRQVGVDECACPAFVHAVEALARHSGPGAATPASSFEARGSVSPWAV